MPTLCLLLLLTASDGTPPAPVSTVGAHVEALMAAQADAATLQGIYPSLHAAKRRDEPAEEPLDPAALQRALADDELLLDFYVGPRHTLLFAVDSQQTRAVALPLSRQHLEARVQDLRAQLGQPTGAPDSLALALGTDLLGPVAAEADVARRIWLGLDGPLHGIPFATLRVGPPTTAGPHDRELIRVPHAGALIGRATGGDRTRPAEILAVSTPTVGRRGEQPGDEVQMLSYFYRGVTVSSDPTLRWRGQEILHVVLAGDRLPSAVSVLQHGLSPRLAVLSGQGALPTGHPRPLVRSFLRNGTGAVISSLWPLDERTSTQLAREFYRALTQRSTPAEALGRAQREVRNHPGTAHPYHWAGLVATGTDTRPLIVAPSTRRWGKIGPAVVLATAGVWFVVNRRRRAHAS